MSEIVINLSGVADVEQVKEAQEWFDSIMNDESAHHSNSGTFTAFAVMIVIEAIYKSKHPLKTLKSIEEVCEFFRQISSSISHHQRVN